jgi:hypothetical protein
MTVGYYKDPVKGITEYELYVGELREACARFPDAWFTSPTGGVLEAPAVVDDTSSKASKKGS